MADPVDLTTPPQDANHNYFSTACQHDLHPQCRIVCKYCTAICECECHVGHENVE